LPHHLRILIVKTSSLGDVVHALPAVTDLRRVLPQATIDWAVEETLADIPRLHPAVARVIPVALRRWRKAPWSSEVRHEWRAAKAVLAETPYDTVIDLQGLLKSVWVARAAKLAAGGALHGYDKHSAREGLAALAYARKHAVARGQHAVARNRALAAAACGISLSEPLDYGVALAPQATQVGDKPRVVLLTATSRADKAWPQAQWVALGQALHAQGIACALVAGSSVERTVAQNIAAAIPASEVWPAMGIAALAQRFAHCQGVVGVDTGLTHLAAAVGTPTVGVYVATDPARTGVLAQNARNLGGVGQCPTAADVLATLQQGMHA
jgi:heptosyltransferase I